MNRSPVWKLFMPSKALGLSLLVLLGACRSLPTEERPDYGLRRVSLNMNAETYGMLNSQLQSKRPVVAEIEIGGAFKVACEINYAGRSSLDDYRKSFDMEFCGEKLNKRGDYRLSAQSIDPTVLRSIIGYQVFKKAGLEVSKTEPVAAYLNQKYLGLYLLLETVDRDFYKARKIGVDAIYKASYGNAGFYPEFSSRLGEAFSFEGKGEDNFTLLRQLDQLVQKKSTTDVFAAEVQKLVMVDEILSYTAAAVYLNHWDGLNNNYFLFQHLDSKKLGMTPWDLDRVYEKPDEFAVENILDRNRLVLRMLDNPEWKKIFLEKLTTLRDKLSAKDLIEKVNELEIQVSEAYQKDPVLHKNGREAFDKLRANIEAWDKKVVVYLKAQGG